jgi:hypothetical protein
MSRIIGIATAVLVFVAAHDAAAQGFINPFIGTTLSSPTETGSATKPGYGVALGAMGKVVGAETEIAFFPELLDNSANAIAKNKVFSVSGDTLIGPTMGRVKPYFAIGAGSVRLSVTGLSSIVTPNVESISNNYFTFNAGGGIFGLFTEHIGARGDLRYTRAFGLKIEDLQTAGLQLDKFNYWRANFGLVVKF